MIIQSQMIYEKIKYMEKISSSSDINFVIDDNNLYIYFKGNPLRMKICKVDKSLVSRDDVIMINNPPVALTDKQYLLFNQEIKFEVKDGNLFINDTLEDDAIHIKIKPKNYTRYYFNFPLLYDAMIKLVCKNGVLEVNGIQVLPEVPISNFKKQFDSDLLQLFIDRHVYIFETKHRIYLKNLNGDYLHLDYK